MFDIGLQEMLVIGVIALLVFGPSRLPELGRMVGRAMREFRRASDEFRSTVETNLQINELDPPPVMSTPDPGEAVTAGAYDDVAPAAPVVQGAAPTAVDLGDGESTEPYAAQRGGRIFHRRDCRWLSRIPEPDRVYLKRIADARDQGFVECPACEPWEPA